jgi:hypothetical protein
MLFTGGSLTIRICEVALYGNCEQTIQPISHDHYHHQHHQQQLAETSSRAGPLQYYLKLSLKMNCHRVYCLYF